MSSHYSRAWPLLFLNLQPGLSVEASSQDQGIVAVVNGKAIASRALDAPRDDEIHALEQQISELQKKGLDEPVAGRRSMSWNSGSLSGSRRCSTNSSANSSSMRKQQREE